MAKNYYIIPIFVPHAGCPHDCVFCNQKKITGAKNEINSEICKQLIEKGLSTIENKNAFIEVAFFGGSFTGIDSQLQKELLYVAKEFKDDSLINGIRLSTRPDYINETILDYLKSGGVDTIELGVQSLNDDILQLSGRGHSKKDVERAVTLIKEYNFNLGLQFMVGLPGDNKETVIETTKDIINLKPNFVRIYPVLVIKNTQLEKLYLYGKYKPFTLLETIYICKELVKMLKKNDIEIIRIGLQPTDNITTGKDIVAGPFHPSLRELIETEIIFDEISLFLGNTTLSKAINIIVNPRSISTIVGQHRKNIKRLEEKYSLKIYVHQDNSLEKNDIIIGIGTKIYSLKLKL